MKPTLLFFLLATAAFGQENTIVTIRQFEGYDSLHAKIVRVETLNALEQPLLTVYNDLHVRSANSFHPKSRTVFHYDDTLLVESHYYGADGEESKTIYDHDPVSKRRIRSTHWNYDRQLKERKREEFEALDPDMGYEERFLAKFYSKKRLWEVNEVQTFSYDDSGRVSQIYTDWCNQLEQFEYDSLGNNTFRRVTRGDTLALTESTVYSLQTEETTFIFYEHLEHPKQVVSSIWHHKALLDDQGRMVRGLFTFDGGAPEISEYSYRTDGWLYKVLHYDKEGELTETELYEYSTEPAR